MKLTEEIFTQIYQYLNGELSQTEKDYFEELLRLNKNIANEVALQKRIKAGLKSNEYKNKFKEIHAQLHSENLLPSFEQEILGTEKNIISHQHSLKLLNWQYFAFAASFILVFGISFYFFTIEKSTEQLVQKNDKKGIPDSVKISLIEPVKKEVFAKTNEQKQQADKPIKQLFSKYFNRIPTLESPFSSKKFGVSPNKFMKWEADTTALQQGINLLSEGKAKAALAIFETLSSSIFEPVKQQAEWYTALAQLKRAKLVETLAQLEKIIILEKHPYHAKAKKMLEDLKKGKFFEPQ